METAQPLEQWPKWRDELIVQLRLKGMRGDRIGDILLETDAHLRESGESPEETFGDARAYATARAELLPADVKVDDFSLLLIGLASFIGSALYASGSWALGAGTDALFGINQWIVFTLGAAIVYIGAWQLPFDFVRHPKTNKPLFGGNSQVRAFFIGALVIVGILLYIFGRLFE